MFTIVGGFDVGLWHGQGVLRAILCKNQTKWEMKNFEPPTKIYMEVGPNEECSKMSVIEVIT